MTQKLYLDGKSKLLPASLPILRTILHDPNTLWALARKDDELYASQDFSFAAEPTDYPVTALSQPFDASEFGDSSFKETYGTKYALYAGAMAGGIASEDLVIALGKNGLLGSFGAGGCSNLRIEKAIDKIQAWLPNGNYLFNLINSPFEPRMERETCELYLKRGIKNIEASAYLGLTESLVLFRASGLSTTPDGSVEIGHRIVGKVSRKEVAEKFLSPAPVDILTKLAAEGRITPQQAELAGKVPMADDISVEADSGGHTDNRPLVSILPAILQLRDEIQAKHNFATPTRIGAGGGIGTPDAVLAAFMMGAAYVVTGSVNQSCMEAGASAHTKKLLADMAVTDCAMAPASDMFEMGVRVQVLKRGTMFAMRSQKLYEIYQRYESIEAIPADEREKLEKTTFKMTLDEVWQECIKFFSQRDPSQIERAEANPKAKMALIFRWYLGLSSRWSSIGEPGREMDYQIWTGPSMGAFNEWTKGSYLADPANRKVADVSLHLMKGAAYNFRARLFEAQGITLPASLRSYRPDEKLL